MKLLATLKDFCTGLAGFLVYVVTLSQLHPLVAVLLTAGCALNWGAQRWAIRKTREVREGKLADDRELRYLQRILRDFSGAGDIRIYSLADWLCARFRAAAGRDLKNERRINGYTFRASWIDLLVLLARDGAAYAYLIYLMGRGRLPWRNSCYMWTDCHVCRLDSGYRPIRQYAACLGAGMDGHSDFH